MERTPIGRFVLILLGVGLASVMIAVFVWLKFIVVPGVEQTRNELKADLDGPMTRQVEMDYVRLTAQETAHKNRKGVVDTLRAPFRWSDVLDLLCDKLETAHKKVWFDTMRVIETGELRSRQQAASDLRDVKLETGLLVEAQSAGSDPDPYLKFRHDIVQKPAAKPGSAKSPADDAAAPAPPAGASAAPAAPRRRGKVLIDYFSGGILKVVNYALKDQTDFDERFSSAFTLEFFVRQGAAP